MEKPRLFNPLDKQNLGNSIVDALLESPVQPLGEIGSFAGAGVYAIYYRGSFLPYAKLASLNNKTALLPIYIGKAIPEGGRKGSIKDASLDSFGLSDRLRKHAASIRSVENLNLADFGCRYLVVDDIWITLGESLLIQKYNPLWNQVVEGFGNNDPGGGRYQGKRPLWDELHPGRSWAVKCQPARLTKDQILVSIEAYMTSLT